MNRTRYTTAAAAATSLNLKSYRAYLAVAVEARLAVRLHDALACVRVGGAAGGKWDNISPGAVVPSVPTSSRCLSTHETAASDPPPDGMAYHFVPIVVQ